MPKQLFSQLNPCLAASFLQEVVRHLDIAKHFSTLLLHQQHFPMPMRTVQPQVRNSFLHRNATINAKPKVAYRSTKVSNKKQGREKLNICPWITRLQISELISFGKWMFQFSKLKWHFIITQELPHIVVPVWAQITTTNIKYQDKEAKKHYWQWKGCTSCHKPPRCAISSGKAGNNAFVSSGFPAAIFVRHHAASSNCR